MVHGMLACCCLKMICFHSNEPIHQQRQVKHPTHAVNSNCISTGTALHPQKLPINRGHAICV